MTTINKVKITYAELGKIHWRDMSVDPTTNLNRHLESLGFDLGIRIDRREYRAEKYVVFSQDLDTASEEARQRIAFRIMSGDL